MIQKRTTSAINVAEFLADRPDEVLRRQRLKDMLNTWMEDDSGYDERVWPELKAALDQNRADAGDVRKLFP